MVVDGVDIKVWSKSEDMYIQSAQYKEWKALKDIPQELKNGVYKDQSRNTLKATAVKAPEFYFSNMPTGKTISFYLEITATTSKVHNVGDKLGSLTGNMISLDATDHRPDNIDASKQVSVIACEDGRAEKADWSLNDVIFLVVGDPDAPHSVNLVDGTPVVEKRQVRYMIEDLGSTNDFDFNDIVVDVEQSRTTTPILKTITDKNGKQIEWLTGWKEEPYAQKAIIRHLGGTLPFKLYIGDTEISEVSPSMDSNPDTEFTVTGWNPENHNVSVAVQQKNSNGMYYNTVPFPKEGEAPMIIATNTNLQWMKERVSIPAEWFIDNRTDEE